MDSAINTPRHIPALDGIRGIAILLVLVTHSFRFHSLSDSVRHVIFEAGNAGVTLFFVLSGYLISRLLLREEQKYQRIDLWKFYIRRAIRLFPALWLYLFTVFILCVFGLFPEHPWYSFVSSLLYIRNFVGRGHETSHLWSLSVEEHFYLIWPLILILTANLYRLRLILCLVGIGAVLVWRWCALEYGLVHYGTLYIRTDFRFDGLLIGCAVAISEQIAPKTFKRVIGSKFRADLLGFFSLTIFFTFLMSDLFGYKSVVSSSTLEAVAGAGMIAAALIGKWWSSILGNYILVFLGRISYGLYLWQQLFLPSQTTGLEFVRSHLIVALTATFFFTCLSFYLIESPLLLWKDKHFQHIPSLTTLRTSNVAMNEGLCPKAMKS